MCNRTHSPDKPLSVWGERMRDIVVFASVLTFIGLSQCLAQSEASAASGTKNTLNAIQERGAFVIGTDIPYGVMEFFDEAGEPAGIDIEIARKVAASLDVPLEVMDMPFDQLFDALESGDIDAVISAVTITQDRQKRMLFSSPYMDAGMSIAVEKDNDDISGKDDLHGKRIGVLKGTVGEELMQESDFVDRDLVISYENNDERLSDLASGELDAVIVHFLSDAQPGIRLIVPPLTQSFYGVAVRLHDGELMESIDAVLRELKRSGEIRKIRDRFLN